jgi:hypothetical protein
MVTEGREGHADWIAKNLQAHLSSRSASALRRNSGSCNSGGQIITMMQPAELWHEYNPAANFGIRPCFTACRRSLRQREMRSVVVVVTDILIHQPSQMSFIQQNDMIEQVPAAAADPAFRDTILPRASEAGSLRLDTKAFHGGNHLFVKIRGTVEN